MKTGSSAVWRPVLSHAPGLVAAAVAAAHAVFHAGFTMDDAAISFSYARSFSRGLGLGVLEAGGPRIDGYSNLLWVLLLAGADATGLSMIAAAKILGTLSFAAALLFVDSILKKMLSRAALRWSGLLISLSVSAALWSASGLESGLYVLLLLVACRLALEDSRSALAGSAIVLLLVGLCRPEGFLFAVAALVAKLLDLAMRGRERRAALVRLFAWGGSVAFGYLIYFVWHLHTFGYAFPNPVYAKDATPAPMQLVQASLWGDWPGRTYVGGWLDRRGGAYLGSFSVVAAALVGRRRVRVVVAFAGAALLLPFLIGDWMVEHRFLVPFVPFAVVLSAVGVDALFGFASRLSRWRFLARFAVVVAACECALLYAATNLRASIDLRASRYSRATSMEAVHAYYAHLFDAPVNELGLERPLVALPDIGAVTFELGMRVLDLGALSDANVAHSHDDARLLQAYLFEERRPELLHAHGHWIQFSKLPQLVGFIRDYQAVSVRSGPELDDNAFEAVRRDLFVGSLPSATPVVSLLGDIALAGLDAPEAAEPSTILPVDIWLTSRVGHTECVPMRIVLVREDGTLALTRPLACGPTFYTSKQWRSGEYVRVRMALPLTNESSTLEIRVLVRDETGEHVRLERRIVIDREAAHLYAAGRIGMARALAIEPNIVGMQRALASAQAAAPSAARWPEVWPPLAGQAARAMAGKASECLQARDWMCLEQSLSEADRLGSARTASSDMQNLALRLRNAGEHERDAEIAYILYRASWSANPQDSRTQRALIEARRRFIAARTGAQEPPKRDPRKREPLQPE